MQYAYRLLGYRMRSVAEVRERLARKAFPQPAIEHALAELTRLGLLDDMEFARSWIDTRRHARGSARLKQELRQKGIARDLAEELMTTVSEDEEFDAAWRLASRCTRGNTYPDRDAVTRVRQMLIRRGFAYAVIRRVCSRLAHPVADDGSWVDE